MVLLRAPLVGGVPVSQGLVGSCCCCGDAAWAPSFPGRGAERRPRSGTVVSPGGRDAEALLLAERVLAANGGVVVGVVGGWVLRESVLFRLLLPLALLPLMPPLIPMSRLIDCPCRVCVGV